MTREEAIKILDAIRVYECYPKSASEETKEALDLAIRALEREIEYGQMVVDYTKGEALESGDWEYTNTPTNDCVSRQHAIEAIEDVDWYHVNSKGELVHGSTSEEESWYKADDIYKAIESLPPVTPPKKIVAQINIDIEELIERIKEEYGITNKVGEWVRQYCFQQWKCSECEYEIDGKTNYCPNCGADMKGEE